MSLQTLKKKSEATSHTYDNTKPFTINGGPRNLSYIGKSMKNSTVKTPFRGTLPIGYAGPGSHIVYANPHIKAELGATPNTPQMSVRNTKSMIATKYKWINGQYPNLWVQPTTNLTSHEYTQHLKNIPSFIEKDIIDSIGTLEPIPDTKNCCTPTTYRPLSVRNIIQRIIKNNTGGHKLPTATVNGFSEYMTRLRASTMANTQDNKPFPFYVNNQCGHTTYTSPPQWYKSTGILTNLATIRCEIQNAKNTLDDAIIEAENTVVVWSNLQQAQPPDNNAISNAESAVIAAQIAARDAAKAFLDLVTLHCQPTEVIQNAQEMLNTEQELVNELNNN